MFRVLRRRDATLGGANNVLGAAKKSISKAAAESSSSSSRASASATDGTGPGDDDADDADYAAGMETSSVVEALARSGARVLIVHGEDDAIVPVANSRRLASVLPGSELVVMPGVGHMPHEERAEEFLSEVRRFITRRTVNGAGSAAAAARGAGGTAAVGGMEVSKRVRVIKTKKSSSAAGQGEKKKTRIANDE